MRRARTITKTFALSRCPTPALLEMLGSSPESIHGPGYIQANLANSCRKLYTDLWNNRRKVFNRRIDLSWSRRFNDMTWVKLTCTLKNGSSKEPKTIYEYLSMPLKHCYELQPCHIGYGKRIYCPDCFGDTVIDEKQNSDDQMASTVLYIEPGPQIALGDGEPNTSDCPDFRESKPTSGIVRPKDQQKSKNVRIRDVRSLNLRVTVKPDEKAFRIVRDK